MFFAQYLAAALLVLTQRLLFLRAELAPYPASAAPAPEGNGFYAARSQNFPLDDILHIVEELAAVVMIDYAKYRPVVSFIFLGVMRGEPPDQQRDKRQ